MDEKRDLVYEISKWSHGASEVLQSWSRQEILQILCAEMGKERKYTGLTKLKIIEILLKIVSEKKSVDQKGISDLLEEPSSPTSGKRASKRQRKTNPSRLMDPVNYLSGSCNNGVIDLDNTKFCKNTACKARIKIEDAFCKRCSCCICYQYDDNKDPSLWLVCSSDPPFEANSCGMSCHLECALKHEKSGIGKCGKQAAPDGSYYCVSCGKVNDLIRCWRKQLVIAKETRRVDILCYRISLSEKLVRGIEKYQKIYEIISESAKMLETEVGSLTSLHLKTGRGIVNRLSSGPQVQKLCALAVESLDDALSNVLCHTLSDCPIQDSSFMSPTTLRFEEVGPTSLSVVLVSEKASIRNDKTYILWHRKVQDTEYPTEPTCQQLNPNTSFVVKGLLPGVEYNFRVVSFNTAKELDMCEAQVMTTSHENEVSDCLVIERSESESPVTNCSSKSSLSNPSSVEDETNNSDHADNRADNYPIYSNDIDKIVSANLLNEEENPVNVTVTELAGLGTNMVESTEGQIVKDITAIQCEPYVGSSEGNLPITPCKLEKLKDLRSKSSKKIIGNCTATDGSTSKKSGEETKEDECKENGVSETDFEYYVKVIRWLECEGHIEKNFRQKFLTWYSLRATEEELRVVKVFVDTFIEDPSSLAGQLIDTFSEIVSNNRSSVVASGFCMKLWH